MQTSLTRQVSKHRLTLPSPRVSVCVVCRSFQETDWYDNFEFFNVVHHSHADKLKVRRDTGHVWMD
jgi:hypothetical protein